MVINRNMTTDNIKLEKIIKEQANQIDSLKKAFVAMQRQMHSMSQKLNRTYETSRKSANDINTLTGIIRKNG